ncbi:cupin domain-containing protein [Roseomonas gilardii]|uniref:cupin domain-containing protein n=1 Tax=Roseomonas gilardii TaxID=257708 RepID=UPI001C93179F|nr:cupin domain-containing protein [Roseomonas gilardii]
MGKVVAGTVVPPAHGETTHAPETLRFGPNGWMPNNPALPVLIYHGAVQAGDPDAIEADLRANRWRPDWRWTVYSFHHYHSTGHEALACVSGSANLMLGGEGGTQVSVGAGDLLVLPAGTGHCLIRSAPDFLLVGAYPDGQHIDLLRSPADAATLRHIAAVPLPSADPVSGTGGPLTSLWQPAP